MRININLLDKWRATPIMPVVVSCIYQSKKRRIQGAAGGRLAHFTIYSAVVYAVNKVVFRSHVFDL